MKKIGIFIFVTLWILAIINIWQIHNYIHTQRGIHFFEHWNFEEASQEFQKVKDITSLYNDANSLYKQGKFEESIQKYWLLITWDNDLLDFYQYYNKGNSFYKQWIQDSTYREKLRKQAITSYDFALSLQDDKDTKYNKSVVVKALKKLQEEKQKDSSNNSSSQGGGKNNKDWSGWNNNTSTQWDSKKENQNNNTQNSEDTNKTNKQWTGSNSEDSWYNENIISQNGTWWLANTWSMDSLSGTNQNYEEKWTGAIQSWSMSEQDAINKNNEEKNQQKSQDSNTEISQEQLQAIQNYKQQLSDQQKQYGKYYNKTYKEKSNNTFENFFNDPAFDNGSLNWADSDKKDW